MAKNETTTIVESKPTKTSKTPTNGKKELSKKEIAKVVKKAKVKLTADDRERMKDMTAEERKHYEQYGTLRGIHRSKPLDLGEAKMGGFDSSDLSTLRLPQVRILIVLSKTKGLLDRKTISAYSGVEEAWMRNWIGQPDKQSRLDREKRWGFTSLVTIGAARFDEFEQEGRTVIGYEITAKGKQLLEKWAKEFPDKYKDMVAKVTASTKAAKE